MRRRSSEECVITGTESPEDRFTRAFDTAGSDFDRLGAHLWFPIGEATVAATAPAPGDIVLDACCGTGASAIPAAHRVGPSGRVDAVDLSSGLIGELVAKAADLPHLRPVAADATTWPTDGYDIVQAVLGVFFFPDMDAGTEHLVSRARPGGRVGITVWRRGAMEVAGRHLYAAVARVTGVAAPPRPVRPIDAVNEADTLRAWLGARGLDQVTVTEHALRLPTTPELAWLVVTGSGFVAALAELDAEQVAAVREDYLAALVGEGVRYFDATTLVGVGTRPLITS